MAGFFRTVFVALLVSLAPGPALSQSSGKDEVVSVPSDDRQMNAAIERARETLPYFWKIRNNPDDG